jgi:hypothetical protein
LELLVLRCRRCRVRDRPTVESRSPPTCASPHPPFPMAWLANHDAALILRLACQQLAEINLRHSHSIACSCLPLWFFLSYSLPLYHETSTQAKIRVNYPVHPTINLSFYPLALSISRFALETACSCGRTLDFSTLGDGF